MTDDRKTLGQMANEASNDPASDGQTCPKCGCRHMFFKTQAERSVVLPSGARHVWRPCRMCGTKFVLREAAPPPAVIVREVVPHKKFSNDGKATLQVHRETA